MIQPFAKQLRNLGFKVDYKNKEETVYYRDSGEITLNLYINNTTLRFFLEYANDFLNIRTTETYHAETTELSDILNPFLYNITRLKGVETSND